MLDLQQTCFNKAWGQNGFDLVQATATVRRLVPQVFCHSFSNPKLLCGGSQNDIVLASRHVLPRESSFIVFSVFLKTVLRSPKHERLPSTLLIGFSVVIIRYSCSSANRIKNRALEINQTS